MREVGPVTSSGGMGRDICESGDFCSWVVFAFVFAFAFVLAFVLWLVVVAAGVDADALLVLPLFPRPFHLSEPAEAKLYPMMMERMRRAQNPRKAVCFIVYEEKNRANIYNLLHIKINVKYWSEKLLF